MELFNLLYAVVAIVAYFALAFVVFHVCKYALHRVNVFRQKQEKKPFNDRTIMVLSVLSGLSFLL